MAPGKFTHTVGATGDQDRGLWYQRLKLNKSKQALRIEHGSVIRARERHLSYGRLESHLGGSPVALLLLALALILTFVGALALSFARAGAPTLARAFAFLRARQVHSTPLFSVVPASAGVDRVRRLGLCSFDQWRS